MSLRQCQLPFKFKENLFVVAKPKISLVYFFLGKSISYFSFVIHIWKDLLSILFCPASLQYLDMLPYLKFEHLKRGSSMFLSRVPKTPATLTWNMLVCQGQTTGEPEGPNPCCGSKAPVPSPLPAPRCAWPPGAWAACSRQQGSCKQLHQCP